MSLGLTRAISYPAFAAFFVTSKLVIGPCLPARAIGLEANPSPATQTGLSVIFLAFVAFATRRHAAPSAFAQQSNSFSGVDTGRDLSTSSMLTGFWNIALEFFVPYFRFFTVTAAMSSSVAPYCAMCAIAYIAYQAAI